MHISLFLSKYLYLYILRTHREVGSFVALLGEDERRRLSGGVNVEPVKEGLHVLKEKETKRVREIHAKGHTSMCEESLRVCVCVYTHISG